MLEKIQHNKDKLTEEPHGDGDSDYRPSDEIYHSHISSDDDDDDDYEQLTLNCNGETSLHNNKSPMMKINMRFPNVTDFRRALDHYAVTNEFDFFIEKSDLTRFTARCKNCKEEGCQWRIHASFLKDKVTFTVKKLIETHNCTRSNKGGNRRATQGWIADIVKDKLKSNKDISVTKLMVWLMKHYNVDVPYQRVFRGKEQAHTDIYGKWEDSFIRMDDYKEKLLNKNPGSVVAIDLRQMVARKFTSVLVAATSIDYNTSIFHVAFGVPESENTEAFNSWIGLFRYQPVIDMLDSIREKIMKRFDKKRRIVKTWNGTLVPMAKNHLNTLSKVKGIPCVHAVAFIAFTRDTNSKKHVDPLFIIEKFKEAYALEVVPIPRKNEWAHIESGRPLVKIPCTGNEMEHEEHAHNPIETISRTK
ncbi:transposase, MuDR, MULE transposase domain protein [Tanacetum coccineum]